jgi:hypothetical protein
MPLSPIDGLSPRSKPPLGFLREKVKIGAEFVRQGGKGQYASVEAIASPSRTFEFKSAAAAWDTPEERAEYEPHLLHGILIELVSTDRTNVLGAQIEITTAKSDLVRSSPMAFFNVGRLLAVRLMATEGRDGEPNVKEGL